MRTEPQFKIIAFFVSARGTQFHSELFNAMGIPVLEIHSRKSQAHRTRVSDQFRSAASAIMFSSDVSARGVDYPDVTLVIQVGVPADKSQCVTINQPPLFICSHVCSSCCFCRYIHRLGRTARTGKAGQGLLLLTPPES
jgi:ATP-dependent RNA helicase MSS116